MSDDSLDIVREKVIEVVSNTKINNEDKAEILINLYHFLDKQKYKNNIKTLMLQNNKKML